MGRWEAEEARSAWTAEPLIALRGGVLLPEFYKGWRKERGGEPVLSFLRTPASREERPAEADSRGRICNSGKCLWVSPAQRPGGHLVTPPWPWDGPMVLRAQRGRRGSRTLRSPTSRLGTQGRVWGRGQSRPSRRHPTRAGPGLPGRHPSPLPRGRPSRRAAPASSPPGRRPRLRLPARGRPKPRRRCRH